MQIICNVCVVIQFVAVEFLKLTFLRLLLDFSCDHKLNILCGNGAQLSYYGDRQIVQTDTQDKLVSFNIRQTGKLTLSAK